MGSDRGLGDAVATSRHHRMQAVVRRHHRYRRCPESRAGRGTHTDSPGATTTVAYTASQLETLWILTMCHAYQVSIETRIRRRRCQTGGLKSLLSCSLLLRGTEEQSRGPDTSNTVTISIPRMASLLPCCWTCGNPEQRDLETIATIGFHKPALTVQASASQYPATEMAMAESWRRLSRGSPCARAEALFCHAHRSRALPAIPVILRTARGRILNKDHFQVRYQRTSGSGLHVSKRHGQVPDYSRSMD